jgi:lysyl-tRNA synthetase class 2
LRLPRNLVASGRVGLGAEIGKEYEDFEVTQAVFEKLIEPTLLNPTFVTHAPKQLIPLAKLSHR